MANQEQVEILMKGVKVWNKWRKKNPDVKIDFSDADLHGANLSGANLSGVVVYVDIPNVKGARRQEVSVADLSHANLSGADLVKANFSNANLSNAKLIEADLEGAYFADADLTSANLSGASFFAAHLSNADLSNADLSHANLTGASISNANLCGANLSDADLCFADLRQTDLRYADISGTAFYLTPHDEWKIDGIKCDYVYFDYEFKERTPKDRDFRPGEFEELYKQLPTIEYYFENSFTPIDAIVIDKVVQAINEKHPEFELKLDSFHSRGQPHAVFTILHKDYADEAIRLITLDYEMKIKKLEGKQESLMEVISMYMNKPQIQLNIEKIVQAEKIEDRSIHAGGDVIDSKLAEGDGNKL